MNTKEVGELRRRLRPGKNAISHIYGCYVGATKEIIAEVDQSTALLSEDHKRRFFFKNFKVR